jgi:hypothetical protein
MHINERIQSLLLLFPYYSICNGYQITASGKKKIVFGSLSSRNITNSITTHEQLKIHVLKVYKMIFLSYL